VFGAEDRELLELVAKPRLLVVEQVQARFALSAADAGARVGGLLGAGLVRRDRASVWRPWSFRITRLGLAAIGSELPAPRFDPRSFRHDVAVSWIWLAGLDGRTFGPGVERVLSERVMRHEDQVRAGTRASGPDAQRWSAGSDREAPFGVRVLGAGGGGLRYPDAMLVLERGRVAITVALGVSSIVELEALLAGYGAAPAIAAVHYLVTDSLVGDLIAAAATRVGLSDLVSVQLARGAGMHAARAARGSGLAGGVG
jgi:hypothetical protein